MILCLPVLLAVVQVSCFQVGREADPLSLWNEGASKKAIVEFVERVTDSKNPDFVPVAERLAVFDNDGTLWCEHPLYFEFVYSLSAMKDVFKDNPALLKKPELKALASGDMKTFIASGDKGMLEAFVLSHTAVSTEQFDRSVGTWLDTATHPRFGVRYVELTYEPMVQLLRYLRDKGFTTYIVSGGSSMFMRNFTQEAYGIPPGQVIGSMLKGEFVAENGTYDVRLKPEVFHIDDGDGKPVGIYQFIGRKPILAFGNSDGDLPMLRYTATNSLPNLELILRHTDPVREYAYDRESPVGRLDKALDEAIERNWVVVDMKNDFRQVFFFEADTEKVE